MSSKIDARMAVYSQTFVLVTQHRHKELIAYLRTISIQPILHPIDSVGHCAECIDILIRYGADPYRILSRIKDDSDYYWIGYKRLLYHIRRFQTMAPLLIGLNTNASESALKQFRNHPLYTRDVLRAVIRLTLNGSTVNTPMET